MKKTNHCHHHNSTFKNSKVVFNLFFFYWDKGPHLNILYKIYCKKCGELIESGNHFDFNKVKDLITGNTSF